MRAKGVVESFVRSAAGKPRDVETSLRRYLKALTTTLEHLPGEIKEIRFSPTKELLAVLESASDLNTSLLKKLRANEQRNEGKRGRALTAIRDELDPK
jgi:hypothetical protein